MALQIAIWFGIQFPLVAGEKFGPICLRISRLCGCVYDVLWKSSAILQAMTCNAIFFGSLVAKSMIPL